MIDPDPMILFPCLPCDRQTNGGLTEMKADKMAHALMSVAGIGTVRVTLQQSLPKAIVRWTV